MIFRIHPLAWAPIASLVQIMPYLKHNNYRRRVCRSLGFFAKLPNQETLCLASTNIDVGNRTFFISMPKGVSLSSDLHASCEHRQLQILEPVHNDRRKAITAAWSSSDAAEAKATSATFSRGQPLLQGIFSSLKRFTALPPSSRAIVKQFN